MVQKFDNKYCLKKNKSRFPQPNQYSNKKSIITHILKKAKKKNIFPSNHIRPVFIAIFPPVPLLVTQRTQYTATTTARKKSFSRSRIGEKVFPHNFHHHHRGSSRAREVEEGKITPFSQAILLTTPSSCSGVLVNGIEIKKRVQLVVLSDGFH